MRKPFACFPHWTMHAGKVKSTLCEYIEHLLWLLPRITTHLRLPNATDLSMLFGLSYGEFFGTVAILAILIGPKELPVLAKTAGRLTGQAAAFISRSRVQWAKFAEETEITQLHKEMQESMTQLRRIESELRGGVNFMAPGPLAQRMMRMQPQQAATTGLSETLSSPASQVKLPGEDEMLKQLLQKRLAKTDPILLRSIQEHLTRESHPASQAQAPDAVASQSWQGHLQPLRSAESSSPAGVPGHERIQSGDGAEGSEQLQPLPVSAVSAGLAPERSGDKTPTGADIALDALMEEEVAHSAQQFLKRTLPKA